MTLFRKEALDENERTDLGPINIATPVSYKAWSALAIFVVVLVTVAIFTGHYTRRIHVEGSLVSRIGQIDVHFSTQGRLVRLAVAQGQHVARGAEIAELSTDRVTATGSTYSTVDVHMADQEAELKDSIETTRRLFDQKLQALNERTRQLQLQLSALRHQADAVNARRVASSEMSAKVKPLISKGYISALQAQQQLSESLSDTANAFAIERDGLALDQQLRDAVVERSELPGQARTEISNLKRQLDQLQQSRAEAAGQTSEVIRAPKSGYVSALLVHEGQAISNGQLIAAIVPDGSEVDAELLIDSHAIGFVAAGSAVQLHVASFPYQKFGLLKGKVSSISNSAVAPTDVGAHLGRQPPGASLFLAKVSLERQAFQVSGQDVPLAIGTSVEGDVMLESRSIAEWIFEPLIDARSRFK